MTEQERLFLSDLFDMEIILKDNDFYYELKVNNYVLDGVTDTPIRAVLEKGCRVTKKELYK